MEYYGYAERNADSQVDWATIGKGMSDMLSETNRIREEKKSAIDAATRQYSKTLTEVPLGEHVGAREAALRFGDNAAQYQLMQDRLLKSGALKLKDYTIARQNLIDGTEQAFTMYKNFQEQATEKMERARTNKSQPLELELMQQIQSWGNFSESDIYINPTNGALNIGKVTQQEIDGKTVRTMSTNPADFTTIGNAQANLYAKYDKFEYQDKLTSLAESFGKEISAVRQYGSDKVAGSISTYLDIMQRTGRDKDGAVTKFIDSETATIKSLITNPFDRLSILTADMKEIDGKPFKFVYKEEETKGHPENIYIERKEGSGHTSPKLTPQQDEAVVEYLRKQIRLKYDRIETINPYNEPNQPEYKYKEGKADELLKTSGNFIAQLYSGDDSKIEAARNHFRGMSNIQDINRTETGVSVTTTDGTTKEFPFYSESGKLMGMKDFVASISKSLLGDDADVKKVWSGMTGQSTAFNKTSKSQGGTENVGQKYVKFVDDKFGDTQAALALASPTATTELQKIYDNLGFKFEDDSILGFFNGIKVTPPQGTGKNAPKVKPIVIKTTGSLKEREAAAIDLRDFIKANTSEETIYSLNDKGVFGKVTPKPKPVPTPTPTPGGSTLNASQRLKK